MYYSLADSILNSVWGENQSVTKDEIIEHDNNFKVLIELAGVKKDDIDISFDKDMLVVTADKKEPNDKQKVLTSSRLYGKIIKKYKVGSSIDRDGVLAEFVDGVLSISLKKSESHQPKKISIL